MSLSPEAALITAIADALPVGVWVARAPDGAFVYANRAFQEIMGLTPRADAKAGGYSAPYGLYGRDGKLYPEEHLPFACVLRTKATVVIEDIVIHRGDGKRAFIRAFAQPMFDPAGVMTHVAVAFTDKSDEVRANETRAEVEARLRNILAHVPMILFAYDCEGVITMLEGRGTAPFGRADDFVGRSVFDIYADNPEILASTRRALGGEGFTNVLTVGPVVLETTNTPMRDAAGAITGVTGVSTDVTARERMHAQLVQAERLASMGKLAATVAHEINNPLTYVLANLEVLSRRLEALGATAPDGFRAEALDLIKATHEGADRVRRIVRGLKAFSRQDDEPAEATNVQRVLDLSLAIAENEIRHRARLCKDYRPVSLVLANEMRLSQVFVNLLVNAAHAIPEGHADQHEIRVRTSMMDGMVIIAIEDTGSGMEPELRARIFEPFFTTKAVGVGTGLGLSVCYGIINGCGGTIESESTVGTGSTFRVRLPAIVPAIVTAADARSTSVADDPPRRQAQAARRGRVLIVDDDSNVAKTLGMLLEPEHEVRVLTKAKHALDLLIGGAEFDVIFCDLMMPEMTGMDLHRLLVEAVPAQAERIVFMTGGAFTEAAQDFLNRVPNTCLEKPFAQSELDDITRKKLASIDPVRS
jgi:PAS domain S-box-containing protein